jgi:hypothetical protein
MDGASPVVAGSAARAYAMPEMGFARAPAVSQAATTTTAASKEKRSPRATARKRVIGHGGPALRTIGKVVTGGTSSAHAAVARRIRASVRRLS